MIYTPLTKKAAAIAYNAHKDVLDKGGYPYIMHPLHLAEKMTDETTTAIALLHDVIEDTDLTGKDLIEMGIPRYVVECVEILSHTADEDYSDYIAGIKANPHATAVKLADLEHNSDLSRLEEITPRAIERVEKYKKAIEILKG